MNYIAKTLFVFLVGTQIVFSQLFCGSKCFRMRDQSVMTFYQGQYATNSAGQQFPHIYCAEGNACGAVDRVKSVQCFNKGVDLSGKVNWKCESNIVGNDFSVDYTNPTCEGWSSPNDNEYAHSDSCICMVKLSWKNQPTNSGTNKYVPPTQTTTTSSSSVGENAFLGLVLFFVVMAIAFNSCCGKSKLSSSSYTNGFVSNVSSSVNNIQQAPIGLRHRNVTTQQSVSSHGVSNNAAYPTQSHVSQLPVQQLPVQQSVSSHGVSTNSAYPIVQPTQQASQTSQLVVNVQTTTNSHGVSNNSAYPTGNNGQQPQQQPQQTVNSHGTSNNNKYPTYP